MRAYIFNADIYCEDCGEDIKRQIREEAKNAGTSVQKYVQDIEDSDRFPQGPYDDGGGEADTPQHCGSGESCLNAEVLKDGRKVGCFLENPLTQYGEEYVKEQAKDDITRKGELGEVVSMWVDYYGIEVEEDDEPEEDWYDDDDTDIETEDD